MIDDQKTNRYMKFTIIFGYVFFAIFAAKSIFSITGLSIALLKTPTIDISGNINITIIIHEIFAIIMPLVAYIIGSQQYAKNQTSLNKRFNGVLLGVMSDLLFSLFVAVYGHITIFNQLLSGNNEFLLKNIIIFILVLATLLIILTKSKKGNDYATTIIESRSFQIPIVGLILLRIIYGISLIFIYSDPTYLISPLITIILVIIPYIFLSIKKESKLLRLAQSIIVMNFSMILPELILLIISSFINCNTTLVYIVQTIVAFMICVAYSRLAILKPNQLC